MKKYFEGMRGHEKFTMSLEISSGPPPPGINNDCSLLCFVFSLLGLPYNINDYKE